MAPEPTKRNSEMIMVSASDRDEMISVRKTDVMELMEIIRRFSDTLPDEAWAAIYGAAIPLVPPDVIVVGEEEEVEFSSGALKAVDAAPLVMPRK